VVIHPDGDVDPGSIGRLIGETYVDDADPKMGWMEPVGMLYALRSAVRALATGSGKFQQRMEKVTYALYNHQPEHFPPRLRNRATNVLSTPGIARRENEIGSAWWDYSRLTPKQRLTFVEDLLSLYEACLMDLGKMGENYLYPKDRPAGESGRED
jgi:hypothetical protein